MKVFMSVKEFYLALDKSIGLNTIYQFVECGKNQESENWPEILIVSTEVEDFPLRFLGGENTLTSPQETPATFNQNA